MTRSLRTTILTVVLLCAPTASWAKGEITRIVIDPMDAGTPIEITDPQVLDRFTIWSGPGVVGWSNARTPDAGEPEFLIDWTKDPVLELPTDLKHYKVIMYVGSRETPGNRYEVLYGVNTSARDGYIYLPGPGDGSGLWNTSLIYRGVEGNWFKASQTWEAVAKTMLDEAGNE